MNLIKIIDKLLIEIQYGCMAAGKDTYQYYKDEFATAPLEQVCTNVVNADEHPIIHGRNKISRLLKIQTHVYGKVMG